MNYVTTNIRISEQDYLELKAEAARSRKTKEISPVYSPF